MLVFAERGNAEYLEKNVAYKRVESEKLTKSISALSYASVKDCWSIAAKLKNEFLHCQQSQWL